MAMSFDYLWKTVFPSLGFLFGFIAKLGTLTTAEFVDLFFFNLTKVTTFSNLFNGKLAILPSIPNLINLLVDLLKGLFSKFDIPVELVGISIPLGDLLFAPFIFVFQVIQFLLTVVGQWLLAFFGTLGVLNAPAFVTLLLLVIVLGIVFKIIKFAWSFVPFFS